MTVAHFFDGGWMGFGPAGFFWGLLMMTLWIVFWIAVIAVVVRLVRKGAAQPRSGPALHVLEERYARGEISREEFNERRAVLLGRAPPSGPEAPTQQL